ncbi:MAG: methyltransferase family protein [Candidatus Thorarchaeota archaeon]
MSSSTEHDYPENNYIPAILGFLNFSILLPLSLSLMNASIELWDFIFVAIGVYLTVKFGTNLSKAHEDSLTRVDPKQRNSFPKEGIYARIRHPVEAGVIYMNIAYVFFFRSLALIPIVPIFAAMWYLYAKYEERVMLNLFGDEYREYMQGTSMFRGAGSDQQRLASSGYDMY